ncbi:MAG: hypothetical protein ACHQFW_01595 [Chitinophagales bacterium]
MDIKLTEIEITIDKLNLLFNSAKEDGALDKVEIELLKKYVQQLLDKLNAYSSEKILKNNETPIVREEKREHIKNYESPPEIVVPIQENKEEKKIISENKKNDEINIKAFEEKGKIEPEIKKEIIQPPVFEEKKPIARINKETKLKDKFNTELNTKSIGDKKTLAEKLVSHKAKDLKSVIDLNDKLFFIKRLFKGDKDAYDNVIRNINSMSGFTQVKSYIETNLSAQFNWNDTPAVERFLEVVQLKYEE